MIYSPQDIQARKKILALSLNDTIIKTASGSKYPSSIKDWQFWHPEVPNKLKEMEQQEFKIVVFTNQKDEYPEGILIGKGDARNFRSKANLIIQALGVRNMQMFVAKGDDKFRKPCPYMWFEFA